MGITYHPPTRMLIYRSKMHATVKHNGQLMPADQWLKRSLSPISDKNEHRVRYKG